MNPAIVWEKCKKVVESCETHEQCNVARRFIDIVAYDLMSKNGYQGYYNDVSNRLRKKRMKIEEIEDDKLVEKWNAETKSEETTS